MRHPACPTNTTRPPLPAGFSAATLQAAARLWRLRSDSGRARLLARARRHAARFNA